MTAQLTVMSFNIRHGLGMDDRVDLDRIAAVVERHGPDVVGMQEVDRHFRAETGYVDQAWWLGRRLGMTGLFGGAWIMEPPGPGRPAREYGEAILARPDVVSWDVIALPARPGHEDRALLRAELSIGGEPVRVWSTHLSHESEEQRLEQANAIGRLMDAGDPPHVLIGDLNTLPDGAVVAQLTDRLVDVWAAAGDGGPGYTFDSVRPSRRIDYVLTAPGVAIEKIDILPVGDATDHLALLTRLTIPTPTV